MSITKEKKQELFKEYGKTESDVGSPQSQIAVLTFRINALTEHLKSNHKDHSTRRGLLGLVSRRRRLLDYLKAKDDGAYRDLIERLGIRK